MHDINNHDEALKYTETSLEDHYCFPNDIQHEGIKSKDFRISTPNHKKHYTWINNLVMSYISLLYVVYIKGTCPNTFWKEKRKERLNRHGIS